MMISRRHLAERNFRNYGCHDDRVKKCPRFVDPIDDGERLVRRPPRRAPEQETTMRPKMTNTYRKNVDVAKKAGILKLPPSSAESKRMVHEPQNQPCQMGHRESPRWNPGRNLRWSEEGMDRTGISGAGRKSDVPGDFQDELSHLARLQEEVRKTVESRKSRKLSSEALASESGRASTMNCKPNPEVQSCPDIRSVVDEFRKQDRNRTPIPLLDSREAVQTHRSQPPDAMTQYPSRVDCRNRLLLASAALRSDAAEEQLPRRVRGRSLDHFEHILNDHRHVPMPSRSRSRTRSTGGERVSAGPCSYDRRGPFVCRCNCCSPVGMESPDSRRERLLMQERWDARVWEELRALLQAVPMTSTTDARQPQRSQASKSSSSNETIYGCHTSRVKTGSGGGAESIKGGGSLKDKMTQTEDSSRNLRAAGVHVRQGKRAPSVDRMYNHRRSTANKVKGRSVDKGSQAAAAAAAGHDVHNCDSSITEVTSIWPSTSGSATQDGTSGVTATITSTTVATTSCQSQESLSLLQSISAELLGSSVSSECLRAAIDATTGGQPLDENSVLEAIDREMADVNQFVRETLDVSEIKPKEYLQMHMRKLQKFTSNLEQFISQQKPTTIPDSCESSD